ncbi:MAG: suppressor of fused domain protein [Clostridia bacterium]|nr:suppressor of fused domain protein [Clostridia bacterium]
MKEKELNAIIEHYKANLGDVEFFEYKPTKDMPFKPQLVMSRPNERHDYYVIATIGVSDLKLKGSYTNCEFVILLDKNWKFKLDNVNHNWPLDLIHKISNIVYLTNTEVGYGKYFINDGNKTFCPTSDMGVALIGVPAMLDTRFFELRMGKKSTNFFIITTATFEELKLIKHIGGINFIQRYLLPEGEDAFILRNNKL